MTTAGDLLIEAVADAEANAVALTAAAEALTAAEVALTEISSALAAPPPGTCR